jgi:hypothetical protein
MHAWRGHSMFPTQHEELSVKILEYIYKDLGFKEKFEDAGLKLDEFTMIKDMINPDLDELHKVIIILRGKIIMCLSVSQNDR